MKSFNGAVSKTSFSFLKSSPYYFRHLKEGADIESCTFSFTTISDKDQLMDIKRNSSKLSKVGVNDKSVEKISIYNGRLCNLMKVEDAKKGHNKSVC